MYLTIKLLVTQRQHQSLSNTIYTTGTQSAHKDYSGPSLPFALALTLALSPARALAHLNVEARRSRPTPGQDPNQEPPESRAPSNCNAYFRDNDISCGASDSFVISVIWGLLLFRKRKRNRCGVIAELLNGGEGPELLPWRLSHAPTSSTHNAAAICGNCCFIAVHGRVFANFRKRYSVGDRG